MDAGGSSSWPGPIFEGPRFGAALFAVPIPRARLFALMIETVRNAGRVLALFCLAALAVLAIVQMYSGEPYNTIERILAAVLIITLIVLAFLLVVEVWRWRRPKR